MSILATKLYRPPPRPQLVSRPRLVDRLNHGLRLPHGFGRPLTLISAPAGFGKTTLVSHWLAENARHDPALRVSWLSLDEGDNDLARFLTYLVTAFQRLAPPAGAGLLELLEASPPPPTDALLTALLNDLTRLSEAGLLVLDDYHVIDARPVDEALTFVLAHLPPQLHLVITTREDPNLPLARLRVRGQLMELRAHDLRFTLTEAADFFNQAVGLSLTAGEINALEHRTEGWIAGLQLAALALQGSGAEPKAAAAFVQSFTGSHHFVMDYLVEEVLHQQSAEVQAFLLGTSILGRLSGPLCEAVLNDPNLRGQDTLEQLERANLLLVPLDDQREWYRYHHLFADVLQARLLRQQPDRIADLHRRASAWFAQNAFRPEAIRHALAAGDFEGAAALIEEERSANAGRYFQSATWLAWVKALPDAIVRTRPRLTIGLTWELLFLGELEAAEARLQEADRLLASKLNAEVMSEAEWTSLQTSVAIARTFHAQALGDIAGTLKHAQRALALITEDDHYTHGLVGALLGLACLSHGDLDTAHTHLTEATAHLRRAGNLLFATSTTFVLADIWLTQGRLSNAIHHYEQALQLVSESGEPILQGTANLHLGLSELYRERGNDEAAHQHLRKGEALGQQAALDDWPYRLYLVRACLQENQGDLEGTLVLLDEAERLYHRSPIPNTRPIAALKARVWTRLGRLTEALDWAQRQGLSAEDDLRYLREYEHVTFARVLIANATCHPTERSLATAFGLLERLLAAAEEGGRWGSVIEILILLALAQEAQGHTRLALAHLERALTLAEPEGYVRLFVDEGQPMAELLRKLNTSSGGQAPGLEAYRRKLLAACDAAFPVMAAPGAAQTLPPSDSPLVEPLSQREREILQLIAQGLSNHEISQRLFLALDTVKGYNRKIFDKLQVQRRTEAVARARALGLL